MPNSADGRDDRERAMTASAPWDTLVRYGRGDVDEAEVAALWSWAEGHTHRELMLRGIERLGDVSQRLPGGPQTDAAWARMLPRIVGDAVPPRRVLRLEAAPMAGLSRCGAPRSRVRRVAVGAGLAAGLAALAFGGTQLYRFAPQPDAPPPLREAAAPRGGRTNVGLPDGTRVVLGPESRMRYSVVGEVTTRNVYLEGTALFDVAHDASRPFVVHAAGGEAQAVGTSFGARAYPEDSVLAVTVAEGRVALRSGGAQMGSGTMLEPGQRGLLSTDGLVRVQPDVDVARELGWAEGKLAYDLVPIAAIARDLERWFDVRIAVSDALSNQARVSVTLDAGSVDASLELLAAVLGTAYTRSGTEVKLGP